MSHRVHPETDQQTSRQWRRRARAGLAMVALLMATTIVTPITYAQDGTSGAAPLEETNCVLVPATPISDLLSETGSPAASPDATPPTDLIGATPVSEATPISAATPVAEESGIDGEDLLLEDLTAASTSLTSCLSEGRASQVASHTSPVFRAQLIGSPSPLNADVFTALYETLPPVDYRILEIQDAQLVDDTTATAEIVWQLAYQVRVDKWTFAMERVQGLSVWTVQKADPGSIEPVIDPETVEVTISENRYTLGSASISADAVMFNASNKDAVDHELLVLRLDEGVSTETLLRTPGPQLPEGVAMIGQATIPAKSDGSMLLNDLEPGIYTIVCLLPDEDGVPHLSEGMETTFEVE